MKKSTLLTPLFTKFIRDTETGKRLKKNGERIKKQSIANYKYTLNNLIKFEIKTGFELRICDTSKLTKREVTISVWHTIIDVSIIKVFDEKLK